LVFEVVVNGSLFGNNLFFLLSLCFLRSWAFCVDGWFGFTTSLFILFHSKAFIVFSKDFYKKCATTCTKNQTLNLCQINLKPTMKPNQERSFAQQSWLIIKPINFKIRNRKHIQDSLTITNESERNMYKKLRWEVGGKNELY
jgi:hypothetical protein